MAQVFMRFPGGKLKALTFSYDDGVEQDVKLIEILKKHGLRATFNLNSGQYAPDGMKWPEGQIHRRMSETQVSELYAQDGSRWQSTVQPIPGWIICLRICVPRI